MVERFNVYGRILDDHEPSGTAHFVRSSDYDALKAQRDELVGLLRDLRDFPTCMATKMRVDAALGEGKS